MSGLVLEVGSQLTCPHGGRVEPVAANAQVLVNGMAALVLTDSFPIVGCRSEAAMPDGWPCTDVVWNAAAARVLIHGQPVLNATSIGKCLNSGPPAPGAARAQRRTTKGDCAKRGTREPCRRCRPQFYAEV